MQPPPTLLPLSTPPNLDTDTKFILKTGWMDSKLTDGQTDQLTGIPSFSPQLKSGETRNRIVQP